MNEIIKSMDDAERAARAMAGSGFFQDTKSSSQAIVKIMAGQELGFGPFASMTGVAIIQGKPAIGANLQAAAVKRTGKYNYHVVEMTDQAVELEFSEAGKAVGISRFTMTDAAAAGLAGKDSWKKFPRNMLFARAISNGVKWFAPDIFNGATVYTPDELGASEDADGHIIDLPAQPEPEQPTAEPEPEADPYAAQLEAALHRTTSKGTRYADCTDSQLEFIRDAPKSSADSKKAAAFLIDHRIKMATQK